MKIARLVKAFTVISCLLGFAVTAWSDDMGPQGKGAQGVVGDEAIVSRIDRDKVTLRSATDVSKEITVSLSNAGDLKIGDKVKVQGNIVKKLDALSENAPLPETGSKSGSAEAK